ncbi:PREDICTED: F-box protein DOR-like [Camelina sativa]|uniref:F-box protein DOR-like n=1 Tax=Camelina sativa TaxID=90675 RepID=A0ABM1Q7L3_CAMSA|nr:PREDICTED: F-box protein DOR-like [Camelina sativa]
MKTEQQNVSEEDLVAVTGRNTRSKTSSNSVEPLPVDLIVEICSRLPAKSMSRCRCVSKLWASSLCLPYFTELFLTRSLARPNLLFACRKNKHVFFFSSPQPQNLDDNNSSSPLAASYLMKIPYYATLFERCTSVRGLMFLGDDRILMGKEHNVSVICNPSTGKSLPLPKIKLKTKKFRFFEDTNSDCSHLINYNGKLASRGSHQWNNNRLNGSCTSIKLRVLQDFEKHEWSEHIYQLPAFWSNTVGSFTSLRVVGVTLTNEIVFSFSYIEKPFYVFYYNAERNTIRRVQGLEAFECYSILYTFLDHVGDVSVKLKEGSSSS